MSLITPNFEIRGTGDGFFVGAPYPNRDDAEAALKVIHGGRVISRLAFNALAEDLSDLEVLVSEIVGNPRIPTKYRDRLALFQQKNWPVARLIAVQKDGGK